MCKSMRLSGMKWDGKTKDIIRVHGLQYLSIWVPKDVA